jgi:hypothetical protein
MFEVLVTYRRDYSEKAVERHESKDEAVTAADRIARQQPHEVVRAWVRQVREVKSQS